VRCAARVGGNWNNGANDGPCYWNCNNFISLDPDYSYNVQFYLLDKLTSELFTFTLPAGTPLISKRRKKVGINNRNPTSALDVVGEIKQNGIYVLGYVGKVEDDFNNYKSGGVFKYSGTGASNSPGAAGLLEVITSGDGFVIQRFTEFSAGCRVFVRSYINNDTWTSWTEK
jgi:hypothetical protein